MTSTFLHTVIASNPFGPDVWDLTNLTTELRISNMSPGGHAECQIMYEDVNPLTLPALGSHLAVSDKAGVYWTGRVEDVDVDFRPGGGQVKITARGYASSAADQIVNTFISWDVTTGQGNAQFKQGTGVREAFKAVVVNLCPFISWDDSKQHVGASLAGDTAQLFGKTAQDCFNEISAIGSDLGGGTTSADQVFWNVYCGGALSGGGLDSTSFFESIYKTQPVSYKIDMEDCDATEIAWQMKWIFNRVSIQWTDQLGNKGTATAIDPSSKSAYPAGIGIWKDHFIDGSGHVSSPYEAQLMAESILAGLSKIRPIGKQIKIKYGYGNEKVTDYNDQPVPLWRILAGRMIQINNIVPNNPQLTGSETFFIRQVNWDEWNRELTIMTEEVESIPQIVGKGLAQDASIPNSTTAGKLVPPTNTLPSSPGPGIGPGGAAAPSTGLPGQKTQDVGTGERNVSNIHLLINGFETEIPDGQLGWCHIPFAGHVYELNGWATKKTETNDFEPASDVTIEIYDAVKNDMGMFANRVLVHTLLISGGYRQDDTFNYIVYRDHVLIFKKTGGADAEIIVVSAEHVRDASLVEKDADGTPTHPAPTITSHSTGAGPDNTIVVTWTTDVQSTGYISWGIQSTTENQVTVDQIVSKSHSYTLPAVAPGNTYSYIITAVSKDGDTSTIGGTFTT